MWEERMDGIVELEPEKSREDGTYQWAARPLSPIPNPTQMMKKEKKNKKGKNER